MKKKIEKNKNKVIFDMLFLFIIIFTSHVGYMENFPQYITIGLLLT